MSHETITIDDILIGDVIMLSPRRSHGGHSPYIEITKINRKSFKGVEQATSYQAGMKWTVHKEGRFTLIRDQGPDKRPRFIGFN
jgi:hypothetical protein